jgi:hypothetical protein
MQVTAVARKHGVTRWQVYDWRRRLRQGRLALPESMAPMFASLMVEEPSTPERTMRPSTSAKVEIVIDDMVIRTAVDLEHLPQVNPSRGCATSSQNCRSVPTTPTSTTCCPSTSPKPPQPDPHRHGRLEATVVETQASTCGEMRAYG